MDVPPLGGVGRDSDVPMREVAAEILRFDQLTDIEEADHDRLLTSCEGGIRPAFLLSTFAKRRGKLFQIVPPVP